MSYTYTEHTGNGTQVTYPFTFSGRDKGYIKSSDIIVEQLINDVWVQQSSGWSLSGTNQITFTVAPATGLKLRIRRVVDKEQPYAEFSRNVALDMNSLNNSFVHLLEISQELLDGFYPAGYFIKQNLNMGGLRIINLGDGVDQGDAVNKGQLDVIDQKHTDWNTEQDLEIEGIKSALTSNLSINTIPWMTTATEGQTVFSPPYAFTAALVFINGVFQFQLNGAYTITNNTVVTSEGLKGGDKVYLLIGSDIAPPAYIATTEVNVDMVLNQTTVALPFAPSSASVYLDGVFQPSNQYTISSASIIFNTGVPASQFTALIKA